MARTVLAFCVGLLVVLASVFASSRMDAIASINVTPLSVPISTNNPVDQRTLTFVWTVTPAPGPARTISSPSGAFLLDFGGRQVLASTGPLAAMAPSTGPVVFTETISLPAGVVEAALSRGARQILYARTFQATYTVSELVRGGTTVPGGTPGPPGSVPVNRTATTTAEAAASLTLTGGMGGPLQIFRALLRFDDGSPLRVLPQDTPLKVFADLSFSGGGTLEGVWEIADPNSSAGDPVFVPLVFVRRLLGAGQRVTVEGPPLPTSVTGQYLVRFRIDQPSNLASNPIVRYHVVSPGEAGPPVRISVLAPPPNAPLGAETPFRWRDLPNAVAYQLELYSKEQLGDRWVPLFTESNQVFRDVRSPAGSSLPFEAAYATANQQGPDPLEEFGQPAAGVLLPAGTTEAMLSSTALRHVESGQSYLWRVRAINAAGITVGLSAPRALLAASAEPSQAPAAAKNPAPAAPQNSAPTPGGP